MWYISILIIPVLVVVLRLIGKCYYRPLKSIPGNPYHKEIQTVVLTSAPHKSGKTFTSVKCV